MILVAFHVLGIVSVIKISFSGGFYLITCLRVVLDPGKEFCFNCFLFRFFFLCPEIFFGSFSTFFLLGFHCLITISDQALT
jgi:hypothetical protein